MRPRQERARAEAPALTAVNVAVRAPVGFNSAAPAAAPQPAPADAPVPPHTEQTQAKKASTFLKHTTEVVFSKMPASVDQTSSHHSTIRDGRFFCIARGAGFNRPISSAILKPTYPSLINA